MNYKVHFNADDPVTKDVRKMLNRCISGSRQWLLRDPCVYCHGPATTYDHIVPKAAGGGDYDNLAPSCVKCNIEKGRHSLLIYLWMRQARSEVQYYLDHQRAMRVKMNEVASLRKAAMWLRTQEGWKHEEDPDRGRSAAL